MSPSVINTSKFRQCTPRNQQHQNSSILANFTLKAGSSTEVFVSNTNKPLWALKTARPSCRELSMGAALCTLPAGLPGRSLVRVFPVGWVDQVRIFFAYVGKCWIIGWCIGTEGSIIQVCHWWITTVLIIALLCMLQIEMKRGCKTIPTKKFWGNVFLKVKTSFHRTPSVHKVTIFSKI